jgi:hypothetical protein
LRTRFAIGAKGGLRPAERRPKGRRLEFLHFSSGSSVNQGLIGDLETERSE